MDKIRESKLMQALFAKLADALDETLLVECAELEYRVCLLELGIAEV